MKHVITGGKQLKGTEDVRNIIKHMLSIYYVQKTAK